MLTEGRSQGSHEKQREKEGKGEEEEEHEGTIIKEMTWEEMEVSAIL